MHADRVPRRKQFSSCDSCRKSRVACDALRRRSVDGETGVAACTRCTTRNRTCSFEVGRLLGKYNRPLGLRIRGE